MNDICILLADNDPDYLAICSEYLETAGYKTLQATSPGEARRILEVDRVHLAILDLRLTNDDDQKDRSGLTVAKESARYVPKLILTRFPTYQDVREALKLDTEALPPAIDFVDKHETLDSLLNVIEQALVKHVQINWKLTIRWGEQLSFFHLASLIESEMETGQIVGRTQELEDLFRQLFYDSNQITIRRLLTRRENAVALAVYAFSKERTEKQFVIVCGQQEHIKLEETHYESFIANASSQTSPVKVVSAETAHFATTSYTLAEENLEEMIALTEFYRSNPVETLTTTLDYLFDTSLAPWHEAGRFLETEKSLNGLLITLFSLNENALSHVKLAPQMEAICQESLTTGLVRLDYSPHELIFHLTDRAAVSYPNPIPRISKARKEINRPVHCGIVYGGLNGGNVLVNPQGQTWLVDFSQTDQGPLLGDFVSLETAVKCELLTTTNMQTRHDIEQRLAASSHLDETIERDGMEPEAQKALQVINRIRQRATLVIGDDLNAYFIGLLFYAAKYLATYDPTVRHTRHELIPYLNSLLSAAVLCQKLSPQPRDDLPSQAQNSLWLDQVNKEAWVEGRYVNLSPQEFDLLQYLYHRPGELCSRAVISETVMAGEFQLDTLDMEKKSMEEGRINSAMSRLRRKLEPNPEHPKYIISVRGEGYKLDLSISSNNNG